MVGSDFGVTVGYHNHAWELSSHIDGRPALELFADLLDPVVLLEIDTYWAATAGQDVPALLRRLGARVFALHLKDGPLNGDIAAQLPLGRGDLPAPEIIAAAPEGAVPGPRVRRVRRRHLRGHRNELRIREERVWVRNDDPRVSGGFPLEPVSGCPPWSQCRTAVVVEYALRSWPIRVHGRGLALQQLHLARLLDFQPDTLPSTNAPE